MLTTDLPYNPEFYAKVLSSGTLVDHKSKTDSGSIYQLEEQ
jgi:hypothetical protein